MNNVVAARFGAEAKVAPSTDVRSALTKFVHLDTSYAVDKAQRWVHSEASVAYAFTDRNATYLVERGNTISTGGRKTACSLDFSGCSQAQIDLVEFDGDATRDCAVVVLLCRADGTVVAQDRMALASGARIIASLTPSVTKACFAVRLAGSGRFGAAHLRLTTLSGGGGARNLVKTDIALRPLQPHKDQTFWLWETPPEMSRTLARVLFESQGAAIREMRDDVRRRSSSSSQLDSSLSGSSLADAEFDLPTSLRRDPKALARRAYEANQIGRFETALAQLMIEADQQATQSLALEEFAHLIENESRNNATVANWLAYAAAPSPRKARKLSLKMFKSGNISSAERLLRLADQSDLPTLGSELRLASKLARTPPAVPRRATATVRGTEIAYVASSAPPFITSGYTVRTHQLLHGLTLAHIPVRCYLRPGFPWDRPEGMKAGSDIPEQSEIEQVPYVYSQTSGDREVAIDEAADALERRFRSRPPRIVQAASNYRNALPALIAARRIGVPFIYEVRGLWELSAASTRPGWESTERFALESSLEMLVAREADHVLAITQVLADQLVEGGVRSDTISVLPNAVDTDLFTPREKDRALFDAHGLADAQLTLVYAGSLTAYEGLDDLIGAIGLLRGRGVRVRYLIVGDGYLRGDLERQVEAAGLQDVVTFIGRVRPDQVSAYWSLADVVPLPRKAFKVCKIISPLKPFEAMAMGRPVVLSDLPVNHEIVRDGVTGRMCRPEDPGHLSGVLGELARDPTARQRLGDAGRKWVVEHRTWAANVERLSQLYGRLGAR